MSLFDDVLAAGDRNPARLNELTASEVDQALAGQAALGLVVGSVEQHGPHLPVGTDLFIPQAILERLTLVLDCVIAPPIPYGCRSMPQTGGGEFFGGNFAVDGVVLGSFIEAVIAQSIRVGFKRILLLSWHWENMHVVWEAGMRAHEALAGAGVKIAVIDNPGQLIAPTTIERVFGKTFAGWDLEHAAIAETSLMQWLHPQLVRTELIGDDHPSETVPYDVIPANQARAPRSGVFGPATRATYEKGGLLARDLIEGIGGIIQRELNVLKRSSAGFTGARPTSSLGTGSSSEAGSVGGVERTTESARGRGRSADEIGPGRS